MPSILKCPVCDLPLIRQGSSYQCENGHSFDVAKEGYVNLLLSNQKKSKLPGDNADMMRHRRQFLQQGYYEPLAQNVASELDAVLCSGASEQAHLLDNGCGEGYYTNLIRQHLSCSVDCYGVDISKDAIRYAAKRYADTNFVVGSVAHLPVMDNSVACLVNIFAPDNVTEFQRVLKAGGYLLIVTPTANHLRQLREMIYNKVRPYGASLGTDFGQHFRRIKQHDLSYQVHIDTKQDIEHLFKMTPFYWSTPTQKQAQILAVEQMDMDISFSIELFQKEG